MIKLNDSLTLDICHHQQFYTNPLEDLLTTLLLPDILFSPEALPLFSATDSAGASTLSCLKTKEDSDPL